MTGNDVNWSGAEKEVAQVAFNKAYEREVKNLIQTVRDQASAIGELDDLWHLNNFLNSRRHAIVGKYDYQYSALIFVFAELIREGWLQFEELEGLHTDKLAKIAALVRMHGEK